MLNITYKDRKTNIWVRERTKVIDIINTVRKKKWSWAEHINRLKDDRCLMMMTGHHNSFPDFRSDSGKIIYMVHTKIAAFCDTFKIIHIYPIYFIKTHHIIPHKHAKFGRIS